MDDLDIRRHMHVYCPSDRMLTEDLSPEIAMRKGDTIHKIRDIHGNLHRGTFVVVSVNSSLSGPSYFLTVHPAGEPNATFSGRWYTTWKE